MPVQAAASTWRWTLELTATGSLLNPFTGSCNNPDDHTLRTHGVLGSQLVTDHAMAGRLFDPSHYTLSWLLCFEESMLPFWPRSANNVHKVTSVDPNTKNLLELSHLWKCCADDFAAFEFCWYWIAYQN